MVMGGGSWDSGDGVKSGVRNIILYIFWEKMFIFLFSTKSRNDK